MIRRAPVSNSDMSAVVIDIGNTTTGIATWRKGEIKSPLSVGTDDEAAFDEALVAHVNALPKRRVLPFVIGSVVPTALERIRAHLEERKQNAVLVVGDRIPLPIDVSVTDAAAIGVDRVCTAAAAYETLKTECTVIDFGSAVTVDLVDEEGTLRGGAILPGIKMQLRALHEYTAALPEVEPAIPELPYGRDTTEAMQAGVCRGLAGAVRALVEGYAASLKRWPHVVATGGDLRFISPHCDFLDTLVDHLALRGIGLAYTKHLEAMGA